MTINELASLLNLLFKYSFCMMLLSAGGNLGEVSVEWFVNTTLSTAEYKKDFLADGATLDFIPGQTRRGMPTFVLNQARMIISCSSSLNITCIVYSNFLGI